MSIFVKELCKDWNCFEDHKKEKEFRELNAKKAEKKQEFLFIFTFVFIKKCAIIDIVLKTTKKEGIPRIENHENAETMSCETT